MFDVLLVSLVFLILFGPVILNLANRPRGAELDALLVARERSSAFHAELLHSRQSRASRSQD